MEVQITGQQNVAQAVVEQLAAWQVKYVFGVCGDDILPFLDAIGANGSIKYISAASEAGAAFMASYYARLSGRLGICTASAAGAVNLLEGVFDAYMDGVPVLAITGQVAGTRIGTPAKQYFQQGGLFQAFTGYSETVANKSTSVRLLIRAMSRALLKKTTAHLAFPADVWLKTIEWKPAPMPALIGKQPGGKHVYGDIDAATGLMHGARRPLIIVGTKAGPIISEVRNLADKWGAAVVLAQEAKGLIPDDWHRVIGGVGEGWLPEQLGEADCTIMIGTASFENQFLPQAPVIQLEEETWQINDLFLWDSLAGNMAHIIKILVEGLAGYKYDPAWQEKIGTARKARQELVSGDNHNDSVPIHPARLMSALSGAVAGDTIITLDVGAFMHWFDRSFLASGQQILLSSFWRSMGGGLPAAIAAQLLFPGRQVVTLVGDGGLLMSMGEFATAVGHKLPITVVAIRNHVYGLEKGKGEDRGLSPAGLGVPSIEFSHFAQACGGKGFKVEKPGDLEATLHQALGLAEPALVDVVCSAPRLPYV